MKRKFEDETITQPNDTEEKANEIEMTETYETHDVQHEEKEIDKLRVENSCYGCKLQATKNNFMEDRLMKKRFRGITVLLTGIIAFSLAACVKASGDKPRGAVSGEKKFVVGATVFSDSEEASLEFYEGMQQGIEKYKDQGIIVELKTFDSAGDVSKQVTGLENFIAQQVDAICFAAIDADAVVPVVDQAMNQGIKVVAFDQRVNTEVSAEVTIDNPSVGKLFAEFVAEKLGEKGKALVIEPPPAVLSCRERSDAAIEIFKGHGMEYITVLADTPTRNAEMTLVENALQANPDIRGIVGIDTDTTLAALLACEALGFTDVVVSGPDLSNEVRQILQEGRQLRGVVDTKHHEVSYAAIDATIRVLLGEKPGKIVLKEFNILEASK
jgi:ribose transport system substrate-binding protein